MFLLLEFEEASWQTDCTHLHCLDIPEDYYSPVVVCETKDDLVEWVRNNIGRDVERNVDTLRVRKKSWQGDSKLDRVFYMTPVEIGKAIVF